MRASVGLLWILAVGRGFAADRILTLDGPALDADLAPGESHTYRLAAPTAQPVLVVALQEGVDVTLTALDAAGEELTAVDSPLDRRGEEILLLEDERAVAVRVDPRERAAPRGSYGLRATVLPVDDGSGDRLAAERLRREAGEAYLLGTPDALREAIRYDTGELPYWHRLGRRRDMALTLYSLAALYRLTEQWDLALASARRALPMLERLGEEERLADAMNELGLVHWYRGHPALAAALFEQVKEIRKKHGDQSGRATAANNVCLMLLVQSKLREGVDCYKEMLGWLTPLDEPGQESQSRMNRARALDILGQPDEALAEYQRSLALSRRANLRLREAEILNNQAILYDNLGEFENALEGYEHALPIFDELGRKRWQALVVNNIGYVYLTLGESGRARSFFERALALHDAAENRIGRIDTLMNLGVVSRQEGELDQAHSYLDEARQLAETWGERRREAKALQALAALDRQEGHLDSALERVGICLAISREIGDRFTEAVALHSRGSMWLQSGRDRAGLEDLEAALAIRREIGDVVGEAEVLASLAEAQRLAEAPETALATALAAIEALENSRAQVRAPDLRASFLGVRSQAYDVAIQIRLSDAAARPDGEQAMLAFETSERARARALLELLGDDAGGLTDGWPKEAREEWTTLMRRFKRLQGMRWQVTDPAEAARLSSDVEAVEHRMDRLRAEVDSGAASDHRTWLRSAEVQALLDDETLLLEYWLSDEGSFVWAVDRRSVRCIELGSRRQIESEVRRYLERVRSINPGASGDTVEAAEAVGQRLLEPVADLLASGFRRVAIVPDGVLHYLPFGALPDPTASELGAELLDRLEVVYLPSASTLGLLRAAEARRARAGSWLGVVADPVFGPDDPRFHGRAPSGERAATRGIGPRLERLEGSGREAKEVASVAPAATIWKAFDATLDLILSGGLQDFRILHFATHAVVDSQAPRLSGLALSSIDEEGGARDGFLSLEEVRHLRLGADLVVLSGCETALGRQVRGEGVVGLTRGFMQAGVPRVVASLWRVPDVPTMRLMSRFYRGMLEEGLAPGEALRRAQLTIRETEGWHAPYYWAAFVLLGEWQHPNWPVAGAG